MFALDIIALICAVIILSKTALYLLAPRAYFKWGLGVLERQQTSLHILLLLGLLIVGYYVFTSVAIHVIAATLLMFALFYKYVFLSLGKPTITFARDLARKPEETIKHLWLAITILVVFAIWTLFSLF